MSAIKVEANIQTLLQFYKNERYIFGRCPHCQEPFRLSEVKLTYGKEPPKDQLAKLKKERDKLKERVEELDEQIADLDAGYEDEIDILRQRNLEAIEALNDKWKDRVDIEVQRHLVKTVRQIRRDAVARSKFGQLGKTLEKMAPMFPGFGHHPYDVRPVFDPVDFVIFDGYFRGEVTDITFVEFKTGTSRLNRVQDSIRNAVDRKRVHFETRRLRRETIDMLSEGRPKRLDKLID